MPAPPVHDRVRHYAVRDKDSTIRLGKRGVTRLILAEQIHTAMCERERLMNPAWESLPAALPFDQLDEARRSVCYAVADLFIDRLSRVIHALEFYRDATMTQVREDRGKAAMTALRGKRA
jgi:hypothetical protein